MSSKATITSFTGQISRNLFLGFFALFLAVVFKNIPQDLSPYLLGKLYQTSLVTGIILLTTSFSYGLIDRITSNIQQKYILKKLISVTGLLLAVLAVGIVWVESAQNIALFTGFFTVGVGVAFQDIFKSLIGAIIINSNENIKIGSLIEINKLTGRILDIGFLYTTILELESFENDGDPVGRYIQFPNNLYLIHDVKSFNKKYEYLWEEIQIKIDNSKSRSNLDKKIIDYYNDTLKKDFDSKKIEQFLKREKYYLKNQSQEIVSFINVVEGQLYFIVRMLVPFENKKETRSKMLSFILDQL
jgi:small-conductance mechanosensitive channel